MKFEAKNDLGYFLVAVLLVFWAYMAYATRGDAMGIVFSAVVVGLIEGFLLQIIFHSYLLLDMEELLIVFGFLKLRIPYREITAIRETRSPLSSMAMSLDRLGIENTQCGYVMVAVRDKTKFLEEIKLLNPDIEIIRRPKT